MRARIADDQVTDMLRAVDLVIDIYIDALVFAILKSSAEGLDKEALLVATLHHMNQEQRDLRSLVYHRQTLFS
jgi:hypothetical protein